MESYSCTTYQEQFNAEILNNKEKQEGCLQVKGDGEILRAEIQHISPKGRHTIVVSSNPPMQQKAFQPWTKQNLPTKKESICLVNWREYNMDRFPQGPICRTIHKTADSARHCMAQIPGPNYVGYKPERLRDNWHLVPSPPQATRDQGRGRRTAATQLKPYWRTNYPSYSVWDEGTPATSIPSLVKELAKSTKRSRSASESSSSNSDNYPAMRGALNKPPMGPPMSKARKAKAHFYRMKAGEGSTDLVQYHPEPGSSSGVVEAKVSPPEEPKSAPKGFPKKFLGINPIVTKKELDEGLQSNNENVRSAAFKLHMLISSATYTKTQALQLEQTFLELSYKYRLRKAPIVGRLGARHPTPQEILAALESDSPMFRRKAIIMHKIANNTPNDDDPSYQEAAKIFYQSKADYLETIRLLELGVLDLSMTNLDTKKKRKQVPEIIGTMTIADDLFNSLDSEDPHLKACANDYYSVLISGTSLRDPNFNLACRRFRVALENHNANLRAKIDELQTLKGPGKLLITQLKNNEDMQANLSEQIKDLTLVSDQKPEGMTDMGQPEVKPQGNLREQPEANPGQSTFPLLGIPGDTSEEEIPALIANEMENFASDDLLNLANLDAPIKSESESSVEEEITEAMIE